MAKRVRPSLQKPALPPPVDPDAPVPTASAPGLIVRRGAKNIAKPTQMESPENLQAAKNRSFIKRYPTTSI